MKKLAASQQRATLLTRRGLVLGTTSLAACSVGAFDVPSQPPRPDGGFEVPGPDGGAQVPPFDGGLLSMAAASIDKGQWLDWTDATNVRAITDVHPKDGVAIAWLESRANYYLTNWPGNMTWDAARAHHRSGGIAGSLIGDPRRHAFGRRVLRRPYREVQQAFRRADEHSPGADEC